MENKALELEEALNSIDIISNRIEELQMDLMAGEKLLEEVQSEKAGIMTELEQTQVQNVIQEMQIHATYTTSRFR